LSHIDIVIATALNVTADAVIWMQTTPIKGVKGPLSQLDVRVRDVLCPSVGSGNGTPCIYVPFPVKELDASYWDNYHFADTKTYNAISFDVLKAVPGLCDKNKKLCHLFDIEANGKESVRNR
jgi:hypothetical protein